MQNRPKVGIGVFVVNDRGEFLLGKRKSSHGVGMWCPPGGHLELGESFEQCATRETLEEANIEISDISFFGITNDVFADDKHYVTISLKAKYKSGELRVNEPDKFELWQWFRWDEFPEELFLPVKNLREIIGGANEKSNF